jgi:hypothetical protein
VTGSYVAANTRTWRVLEQAPALLEGGDGEDQAPDPLRVSG